MAEMHSLVPNFLRYSFSNLYLLYSYKVEDETHFLISCSFYDDIRYDLFSHCCQINVNFRNFNASDKLIFIMQTSSLQLKLASSLQKMSRRRNMNDK